MQGGVPGVQGAVQGVLSSVPGVQGAVRGVQGAVCPQEQQCGVGVTAVPMAVGSVKDAERRSFALHTPYRTFRSAPQRPIATHSDT